MLLWDLGYRWGILADSVRGAAHVLHELPNQDAFECSLGATRGLPITIALSDGHSSELSFRSQWGSRFAVQAALTCGRRLAEDLARGATDVATLVEQLPRSVVACWQSLVLEHFAENPFTDDELRRLESKRGMAARRAAEANERTLVAYGATLLLALIFEERAVFLRVGDGEVLTVDDTAERDARRVFPVDDSMVGDVCESLCSDNPTEDCQVSVVSLVDSAPAAILLSTDGYEKSFATSEDFLHVSRQWSRVFENQDPATVAQLLPGHLQKVTSEGCGDDVTLAIVWRALPGAVISLEEPAAAGVDSAVS